jgi:hypothetical protein
MESLIPLGEVARILGLTRSAVHYMAKRGELHRAKVAGRWVYFRPEVEALAEAQSQRRRARDAREAIGA